MCSSNLKPEFLCPGRVSLLNEYLYRDKLLGNSYFFYSWILVHLGEALVKNKIQILNMKSLECQETCCTGLFSGVGVAGIAILVSSNYIRWPKNPVLLRLSLKKIFHC